MDQEGSGVFLEHHVPPENHGTVPHLKHDDQLNILLLIEENGIF